jgi:hypothetical protein
MARSLSCTSRPATWERHHIASSEEPFDRWFRERMGEVHGIDLAEPGPSPRQVHDARF